MKWLNTASQFGWMSIVLHWAIAVISLSLFFSGLWMVTLDYYHPYYQVTPWLHKGAGVLVLVLLLFRWLVNNLQTRTKPILASARMQNKLAYFVHCLMNIALLVISISGYFIVTAQGQDLNVFDLVVIPAVITTITNLEDSAGAVHLYSAYALMILVSLHSLAALKHHFINKDATLLRMLGRSNRHDRGDL